MTPREFLRKPGFDTALLLTWSFDPVFFERIFLRLLHAGGTGRVAVVMDGRKLQELALTLPGLIDAAAIGALGTEYSLDGARAAGHFHPKLWVRTGVDGALVWTGSCNLTEFGWNGQWELGTAWEVGPNQEDDGGWLRPILEDVRDLCAREATRDAIDRMLRARWLPEEPSEQAPVLWSGRRTLSQQVLDRWPGMAFERARMLTGSTDEGAALARWAAGSLGVQRFDLAVTPSRCDLDPEALYGVGCDLRLATFDGGDRPLHAKLLWLDGRAGRKALMGSANFSASAWLRPVRDGGNHELLTVYEAPHEDGFAALLQDCEAAIAASAYLSAQPGRPKGVRDPSPSTERVRVDEARWDSVLGQLTLQVTPRLSDAATIELTDLDDPLEMDRSGDAWTARVGRTAGPWCVRVRIRDDGLDLECSAFVDSQRELRSTVGTRRWSAFFDTARGASNPSEQRRMVEDFARLRAALFQPSREPGKSRGSSGGGPRSESAGAPLDPTLLAGARVVHTGSPVTLGASLRGGIGELLRSIFDFDQDKDQDEPDVDDKGDVVTPPSAGMCGSHLNQRTVERLRKEMEAFFSDLETKELAQKGSPEQVQQAFALPIALALLGLEGEWLDEDSAGGWVRRALEAMLQRSLLDRAFERLDAGGLGEEAMRLLGDGALLAAVRVAVSVVPWPNRLARALALRQVDEAPVLRSCASLESLERLLGCVRVTPEHKSARDTAFEDIATLRGLERDLQDRWHDLARAQLAASGSWLRMGEVVRLRNAWGVMESEEPMKARARAEVNIYGQGTSKVIVEHRGVTMLLDLGLLARLAAELPPTRGLFELSEQPAGPRESSANSIGLWKR